MAFGVPFAKGKSDILKDMREQLIDTAMFNSHNIIVDNTNLNPSLEAKYRQQIEEWNSGLQEKSQYEFIIKDFTDVPVAECVKRDALRANPVGFKVIYSMYDQFLKKAVKPLVQDQKLPKAIVVDLDGTLATLCDRSPYDLSKVYNDKVNDPIWDIVDKYRFTHKLFLVTGRDEVARAETVRWLTDKCGYAPDEYTLIMKPNEDHQMSDTVYKPKVWAHELKDKYNVLFVLEDRSRVTQSWRELGLTVLQCADGFY